MGFEKGAKEVSNPTSRNTRAIDLAIALSTLLHSDVTIDNKVNDMAKEYFSFDDTEPVTIHVADWYLIDIYNNDKSGLLTRCSMEAIFRVINIAYIPKNLADRSYLYSLFSCLHEFGHYHTYLHRSHSEWEELVNERMFLVGQAKKQLADKIKLGLNERQSRVEYEETYRSIPFERIADEYAVKVIRKLIKDNTIGLSKVMSNCA